MDIPEIKEIIRRELPSILRDDPEMREFVLRLTEERYADKRETESRFDRIMDELKRDREEQSKLWREQHQKWMRLAEERAKERRESEEKWKEAAGERSKERRESEGRWNRLAEERAQERVDLTKRWDENQKTLNEIVKSIQTVDKKIDRTLGALGARWGLSSEHSFRSALQGILEKHFDVQVINYREYDENGEVFGRPDQVELDVIIKNSLLIICEIKSSTSRSEIHVFARKAEFYEKRHNKKATQLMVVSPMVDDGAKALARDLGTEVYSYPEDIKPSTFQVG